MNAGRESPSKFFSNAATTSKSDRVRKHAIGYHDGVTINNSSTSEDNLISKNHPSSSEAKVTPRSLRRSSSEYGLNHYNASSLLRNANRSQETLRLNRQTLGDTEEICITDDFSIVENKAKKNKASLPPGESDELFEFTVS